jgi:hypothetical protein
MTTKISHIYIDKNKHVVKTNVSDPLSFIRCEPADQPLSDDRLNNFEYFRGDLDRETLFEDKNGIGIEDKRNAFFCPPLNDFNPHIHNGKINDQHEIKEKEHIDESNHMIKVSDPYLQPYLILPISPGTEHIGRIVDQVAGQVDKYTRPIDGDQMNRSYRQTMDKHSRESLLLTNEYDDESKDANILLGMAYDGIDYFKIRGYLDPLENDIYGKTRAGLLAKINNNQSMKNSFNLLQFTLNVNTLTFLNMLREREFAIESTRFEYGINTKSHENGEIMFVLKPYVHLINNVYIYTDRSDRDKLSSHYDRNILYPMAKELDFFKKTIDSSSKTFMRLKNPLSFKHVDYVLVPDIIFNDSFKTVEEKKPINTILQSNNQPSLKIFLKRYFKSRWYGKTSQGKRINPLYNKMIIYGPSRVASFGSNPSEPGETKSDPMNTGSQNLYQPNKHPLQFLQSPPPLPPRPRERNNIQQQEKEQLTNNDIFYENPKNRELYFYGMEKMYMKILLYNNCFVMNNNSSEKAIKDLERIIMLNENISKKEIVNISQSLGGSSNEDPCIKYKDIKDIYLAIKYNS